MMRMQRSVGVWAVCSLIPMVATAATPATPKSATQANPATQQPTTPSTPAAPEAPAVPQTPTVDMPPPAQQERGLDLTDPSGMFQPLYEGIFGNLKLEPPSSFPVHMSVLVDHSVGNGAFVLNSHAKQPYFASTVRLTPTLSIWKSLRATMMLSVSKEWIGSSTQTYTTPNQVILQDLWTGLGMPRVYADETTGLGFGGGVWVFAPTSIRSRAETMLFGVRPYMSLNWSKWNISASYTFSARKNFHQYVNPTVDSRDAKGVECTNSGGRCFASSAETGPAVRADRAEQDTQAVGGGRTLDLTRRNVSHQLLHFATLSYTVFDSWTFTAMAVLLSSWRYPLQQDPNLSSTLATNAWGHSDAVWSNLDLSYGFTDNISFSTGLFTFQPFYMAHRGPGIPGWDQDGTTQGGGRLVPAFPLVDIITPGNNYSTYYFDVIFSI